jgi:hypothetical protein
MFERLCCRQRTVPKRQAPMQCCLSSSKISVPFSESEVVVPQRIHLFAGYGRFVRLLSPTKKIFLSRSEYLGNVEIATSKVDSAHGLPAAMRHGLSLAPVESDSSKTATIVAEL